MEEKSRLEVNIVAEWMLGKGREEEWFSHPGDQREGEGSPGLRIHPWVGKISWRTAWQPTPVFLPGESHGQRSLAGYSP